MMQHRKIYPSGHAPARWLDWLSITIAALVVLGGLLGRRDAAPIIEAIPTPTPVPLEESFDETSETCEWSLPQVRWYALQLGAFDNETSAQALAEQFRSRGAAGYLWQEERIRVLAAIYASEEDASAVQQQIRQQHGVDSYLYCINLPGAGVSMQGMRGQIELLKAAFVNGTDLVARLQAASLAADSPQAAAADVAATLQSLTQEAELMALRLRQRFPEPRNRCINALLTLYDDFSVFCHSLPQDAASVAYSALLKHQTIQSLDLLRQVYDTLGNT